MILPFVCSVTEVLTLVPLALIPPKIGSTQQPATLFCFDSLLKKSKSEHLCQLTLRLRSVNHREQSN